MNVIFNIAHDIFTYVWDRPVLMVVGALLTIAVGVAAYRASRNI